MRFIERVSNSAHRTFIFHGGPYSFSAHVFLSTGHVRIRCRLDVFLAALYLAHADFCGGDRGGRAKLTPFVSACPLRRAPWAMPNPQIRCFSAAGRSVAVFCDYALDLGRRIETAFAGYAPLRARVYLLANIFLSGLGMPSLTGRFADILARSCGPARRWPIFRPDRGAGSS